MMKRMAFLAVLAAAVIAGGCGSRSPEDTLARIRRTKVLVVGTDVTYPPFETIGADGRTVVGFDADLIRAIAERLEVRADFLVVPFDGILAALKSGKYDAVISALTITEERSREVLFSRPYYAAGQSITVRADEPAEASGSSAAAPSALAGLRGRRIGVQLGTTGERLARGVEKAEIVSFDAIGAAFLDLSSGRLDAVIADTPTAALYSREHPEVRLSGEPVTSESYGIAFRPGDASLKQAVDSALDALERDGVIADLRERWGLPGS